MLRLLLILSLIIPHPIQRGGQVIITTAPSTSSAVITLDDCGNVYTGTSITLNGGGSGACSSLPGVASGDLVWVFAGMNGNTVPTLSVTSGCGSLTLGTGTGNTNNATQEVICLASATTVTINLTNSTGDPGMIAIALHSTTGWNLSSALSASTANSGTTLTPQCPSVAPTSTVSAAFCGALSEQGNTYSSVNQSYSTGPGANAHTDASAYRMNLPAATYNPTFTFTGTAHAFGLQAFSVGAN
jgi:hypothetical protein